MGTQLTHKKGQSPQFSAHLCCGETAGGMKMPLGRQVGLDPGDILLDAGPRSPKKVQSTPILAHIYCGQTAGWIKMSLGTDLGLGPGNIVLDGDPGHDQICHARVFLPNSRLDSYIMSPLRSEISPQ